MPKLDQHTQQARREHILDAAERCFAAGGFHGTSMHDICREAGVSPGALYTYFASKEQLIAGICDREKTKLSEALAIVAEAPDFLAGLSALAEAYCVHQPEGKIRLHVEMNAEALRNPAIFEIVNSIDSFVLNSFKRLLDDARAKGRIRSSTDTAVMAQVLAVIGDGMCWQRAMNKDFDPAVVMPMILSLIGTLIQPAGKAGGDETGKNGDKAMGWGTKIKSGAALIAAILAIAGMAPAPLHAADPAKPAAATEGPAVSVSAATTTSFSESILVTGSLIAREEVLVSPQIEGYRITELAAEEGDRVAEGQLLARLDRSTLEAQLAQLDAQRVRSDAAIAQAGSSIAQAEANLKQAEAAFERAQDLIKSGTTSRAIFDEREAAARTAAATVTSARDGLRVAEADKTQIEAQIRELQLRLGYTEIKALRPGIVGKRNARLGAVATASGDPLFRIIARGEVELDAEVPEIYLPKMSAGMAARVDVAGLPERRGAIRLISPEVDRGTRLGRVRIFIGDDKELRVGTFARGVINIAKSDGLGVPSSAILNQADGQTVQVVRDGKVATRRVRTGLVSGGRTEIVEGLAEGETVVTRSGTLLRDGDAVRPVLTDKTAVSEAK
jgi:RND family efflux transporter MFP subunit